MKGYKTNNKPIFGCVVLVLVLVNQPYPGTVIGLTLCKTFKDSTLRLKRKNRAKENKVRIMKHKCNTSSSLKLDLKPLEVSLRFLSFHKGLHQQ